MLGLIAWPENPLVLLVDGLKSIPPCLYFVECLVAPVSPIHMFGEFRACRVGLIWLKPFVSSTSLRVQTQLVQMKCCCETHWMSTCMYESHTSMHDSRTSSSTAAPAFSVFCPLNFSGMSEGFFFQFQQLISMYPFIWQWLHVRVSFFLPLSSFSFERSFPLCLYFSSTRWYHLHHQHSLRLSLFPLWFTIVSTSRPQCVSQCM